MSATINLEKKHFPVLLNELISILSPLYGGTFIDCTFGQGHYSKKILEFKENKIIALDRDKDVHPKSKLLKEKFKNRFQFYNIKFSQIKNLNLDTSYLKGIIFDLGYSTIQINDPKKGLSFKNKSKLNMKMGINDFSAHGITRTGVIGRGAQNGADAFVFSSFAPTNTAFAAGLIAGAQLTRFTTETVVPNTQAFCVAILS